MFLSHNLRQATAAALLPVELFPRQLCFDSGAASTWCSQHLQAGGARTFLPGSGTIFFAFFSGSVWWTTADCAKETWREGVGKLKEARWKGDHGSLGWLNKRLTSFDVSFFLIIRWSSACFAFWEMPLHFSLIKMACFLLANKLEEESYNNLQYIRQLLLCNDIK